MSKVPLRNLFSFALITALVSGLIGCLTPKKGPRKAYAKARNEGRIPFDAIIVPGIPYEKGGWDIVMKGRVLWSWILYKNGYTKNIIYSGGAIYTPYCEAKIMRLYGIALGIPEAHIYCDTQARHSTENVYYSYLLARQQGFKNIALASDPSQSFLLRGFIKRRFGSPVYLLPFVTDSLKEYDHLDPVIDPKSARVSNWRSLPDQQSIWTRLKGTLGRGIDFSKHPNGKVESL